MNFCSNTVFSLYFKFRAKKIHAAKPLAFSLHFLFRRDQNHYSNLTSKIMKMCEQILKKKDSAPIQFKFFELWKTKRRPIIAPAIAVRLFKDKRRPIIAPAIAMPLLITIVVPALSQRNSIKPQLPVLSCPFSYYAEHFRLFFWWAALLFFDDYAHFFFASETLTWYHHCSQHWTGYGQPEAVVK